MNNEIEQRKEDKERIFNLLPLLKKLEIDNYEKDNYVDALDDTKNWCVATIQERANDKIKVHFDGWSNKYDFIVHVKSRRLDNFRRHSKGYTGQKSTAYRIYTFNWEDFIEIKSLCEIIIQSNFECLTDPLEITQILRGKIFTWIDIFLTCPFDMDSQDEKNHPSYAVPHILDLLYDFIKVFVLYLNFVKNNLFMLEVVNKYPDLFLLDCTSALILCCHEFLITLKRIFALEERTNTFYVNNLNVIKMINSKSKNRICKDECYNSNYNKDQEVITNGLPIQTISDFIDYFYELNGFNLLFDIVYGNFHSVFNLSHDKFYIPFNYLSEFMQLFAWMSPYINYKLYFENKVHSLKVFILNRVINLSEEEVKDSDASNIEEMAGHLKNILFFQEPFTSNDNYMPPVDIEILLHYSYRCFISKNLQKRIKGVSYLDFISKEVLKIEKGVYSTDNSVENILNSNYLFSWFKKNKLLEFILGESIHEEVLKKTLNIFLLYLDKKDLDNNFYNLMWKTILDSNKHEFILKEIEVLFCELSLSMNKSEKMYIFDKINDINLYNLETKLLNFIKNLTINCFKTDEMGNSIYDSYNNESNFEYGIPFFWNILNSKNEIIDVNQIQHTCLEFLDEIFSSHFVPENVIIKYSILCVENIKRSSYVTQSFKLLKTCISMLEKRNNYFIFEKYDLITVIITETENFVSAHNSKESLDFCSKIELRLESLFLINDYLSKSNFVNKSLNLSQVQILWDILVLHNLREDAKNLLFISLINFVKANTNNTLEESKNLSLTYNNILHSEIIKDIFLNILCDNQKFSVKSIGKIEYDLFKTYFIETNKYKKKLFFKVESDNLQIKILEYNLLGMETLWGILINANKEVIKSECASFLVEICLNPVLDKHLCIQFWNEFKNNIISCIQNSNSTGHYKGIIIFLKILNSRIKTEISNKNEIFSLEINPGSLIIENNILFEWVYNIVRYSKDDIINDAWTLLKDLPMNNKISDFLESINETNLKDFLNLESFHTLVYNLRILKNNYLTNREWIIRFDEIGGFLHLSNLLLNINEKYFNGVYDLTFECISEIVPILINFEAFIKENKGISCQIKMFSENCDYAEFLINVIFKIFENEITMIDDIDFPKSQEDKLKFILFCLDKFSTQTLLTKLLDEDKMQVDMEENNKHFNFSGKTFDSIFKRCFLKSNLVEMKNILVEFIHNKILSNYDLQNIEKLKKFYRKFYQYIINTLPKILCVINEENFQSKVQNITTKIVKTYALNYVNLNNSQIESFFNISNKILESLNHVIVKQLLINDQSMENELLKFTEGLISNTCSLFNAKPKNESLKLIRIIISGSFLVLKELSKQSENIYNFILSKIEFINILTENILPASNNNCKHTSLTLLTSLSNNNPKLTNFIIEKLSSSYELGFWRGKRISDWSLTLPDSKSSSGYTGLKNLGCTCYMNSLIQQLNMNDSFRDSILSYEEKDENELTLKQNTLYGLKTMLANLKYSNRKFYTPKEFCNNFRNYEGRAINVLEQMDVDEFFNLLIDRLEPFSIDLIKNNFSGIMTRQMTSLDCVHLSQNETSFTSINLDIKGKRNIIDSLDCYFKGETLQGENAYHCEECDKKVSMVIKPHVKTLPKTLILVLKRLQYDPLTMVKSKIHDFCEFPFDLDMKKYLNNCDGEGESRYKLKGVIIHSGSADSGHYYSIINDTNKWLEFNDTQVNYYDIHKLKENAFGGIILKNEKENGKNKKQEDDKSTNAYVLFYEKQTSLNIEETHNNRLITFDNLSTNLKENIQNDNFQFSTLLSIFSNDYIEFVINLVINYDKEHKSNLFIPRITKNNNIDKINNLSRDVKDIIDLNIPNKYFNYFSFETVNNETTTREEKKSQNEFIFKFICKVFFTTVIRLKDRVYLPIFVDLIKANLNINVNNAEWLLEEFSNVEIISEFLVDCPFPEIKKIFCGLIYCAMIKSFKSYEESIDDERNKLKISSFDLILPSLDNFIQEIIYLISKKQQFLEKDFTFIYFILYRFTTLGVNAKQFLCSKGVIVMLLQFLESKLIIQNLNLSDLTNNSNSEKKDTNLLLNIRQPLHKEIGIIKLPNKEKASPLEEFLEKKQIEKNSSPSDIYILESFIEILKGSNYLSMGRIYNDTINNNYVSISEEDSQMLMNFFTNDKFIKLLILESKNKTSSFNLAELLCNLSMKYDNMYILITQVLLDLIDSYDFSESENVMIIFKYFLQNLNLNQVCDLIAKYFFILERNLKFYKYTEYHIEFIINNWDRLVNLVDSFNEQLNKLIDWLKINFYPPLYNPSETTVMFKKRILNYSNINISSNIRDEYIMNYQKKTDDKISKINKILGKLLNNILEQNLEHQENDFVNFNYITDYTDFKFSVHDRIKYENYECEVLSVLDEMIQIQYTKDLVANRNLPETQWIDTNKSISLISMFKNSN